MNVRTLRPWRARGGIASILLGLLLAIPGRAAPARAEAAALTVSIGDGVDAGAVRARLAAELRAPIVPRADGAACALPCLSITIEGRSATVAFTPVRGASRARTVELGGDPAQWPVVITLLAGNVVRDEAADVLALLPEPAPPPTPPAAASVPPAAVDPAPPAWSPELELAPPSSAGAAPLPPAPERPWRQVGFGLVPVLSTDFTQIGQVSHAFSLDLIAGVSGGSTGVTVSGVADVERGTVSGIQIGGVTSLAWRVAGFQLAGAAAVSGELDGVQLGGAVALAGTAQGGQVGGAAAITRGSADVQIGGALAVAGGPAHLQIGGAAAVAGGRATTQVAGAIAAADGDARTQIAGVAAAARGDTNLQIAGAASLARGANLQIAGAVNVARGTANIQIAGAVNVARRVEGVQIAPFNIARRVDGVQIGVVNVGSADGFSFGLINIVPGGRSDLEASVDSSRLGTLLFRHGGRRWHNVYGVGGHPVDEDGIGGGGGGGDVWMYGLGFGPTWRAGAAVIDLELMSWQINHGAAHYDGLSLLGQLRLSIAYPIGPLSIVAGGAINTHVSSDPRSPLMLERRTAEPPMNREVTVATWPSAFFGVRI